LAENIDVLIHEIFEHPIDPGVFEDLGGFPPRPLWCDPIEETVEGT